MYGVYALPKFETRTYARTRTHSLTDRINHANNSIQQKLYLTSMDMHKSSQEHLPYECNCPHAQGAVGAAITFAPTRHGVSVVPVHQQYLKRLFLQTTYLSEIVYSSEFRHSPLAGSLRGFRPSIPRQQAENCSCQLTLPSRDLKLSKYIT